MDLSSKPLVRYELWHSGSEGCHTLSPENQRPADVTADARLIWTGEAATWNEGQKANYAFLGLESCRPVEPDSDSPIPTP